jgi:hypothetical protein
MRKPIATTINENYGKAPAQRALFGDKKTKIEPATHIIEFPGGAIELSRTSEGNYWAHVIVNQDWADNDCDGLHHAYGEIVGSRIDYQYPHAPIESIPDATQIHQIAILIRPSKKLAVNA